MIALYTDNVIRHEFFESSDIPGMPEERLIRGIRHEMEYKLSEYSDRYIVHLPSETSRQEGRLIVKIKAMVFEFARYKESRQVPHGCYSFSLLLADLVSTQSSDKGYTEISLSLRPCITEEPDVLGLGIVYNEILHWRPF